MHFSLKSPKCRAQCICLFPQWLKLKSLIFWGITPCSTVEINISPPSSGLNSKPSKKPPLPAACFMQISCTAYYSTLKMEVTCSSVDFHHNSQRFVREGITLHNHHCHILKSYMSNSDPHTYITPNTVGYFRYSTGMPKFRAGSGKCVA
jgi:hypothetical protein